MGDLPDYTREYSIIVRPELPSQVRILPWWLRYAPTRILYLDDFEGVLKWYQSAGTVSKNTSIEVFEGTYCMKLLTGVNVGSNSEGYVRLGGVPKSIFSFQCRWRQGLLLANVMRHIKFDIQLRDGSVMRNAAVQYLNYKSGAQKKWQILTSAGTYADIDGGDENIDFQADLHQHIYFTFDFTDAVKAYKRLVTSSLDLDLSDIALYEEASSDPPTIRLAIQITTDIAQASSAFIDALCLSDNEPT